MHCEGRAGMTGSELNMSVKEREKTVVFFSDNWLLFFSCGKAWRGTSESPCLIQLVT